MGFRTPYPKIQHPDILNILNWRSMRKREKQEGLSVTFPTPSHTPLSSVLHSWRRSWKLHLRGALHYGGRKGASLSPKTKGTVRRIQTNRPCKISSLLHFIPGALSLSFHNFPLCIKSSIKTHRFHKSLGIFISFRRLPCHEKLKFVCFSPVILSLSV